MKRNYAVIGRPLTIGLKTKQIGATVTFEEKDGDTLVRAGRLEPVRDTEKAPLVVESQPSSIRSEIVAPKPKRRKSK